MNFRDSHQMSIEIDKEILIRFHKMIDDKIESLSGLDEASLEFKKICSQLESYFENPWIVEGLIKNKNALELIEYDDKLNSLRYKYY